MIPLTPYRVTMSGGMAFTLFANLSEASAPLRAGRFGIEDDANFAQPTPYQTADARHSEYEAAKLVWDYFADDEAERAETVVSVEEEA